MYIYICIYVCIYIYVHMCIYVHIIQLQKNAATEQLCKESGRTKHFIQKKEFGNPCHEAFTLFDYKRAANKKELSQSLPCKGAKRLSFFLQVLHSFMRRVASAFSTGIGVQHQVTDSMATFFYLTFRTISTAWLRTKVSLPSSKQTHSFAIHVKCTKCVVT